MKFQLWLETEEDRKRDDLDDYQTPEVRVSNERPTVYPLFDGIQEGQPSSKYFIMIDLARHVVRMGGGYTTSHRRFYIPFGKAHRHKNSTAAIEIAQRFVNREHGKYSRAYIFRATKYGGNSVFDDEDNYLRFTAGY